MSARRGDAHFKKFYARRVFRLYPALIAYVMFVGIPAAIASGEGHNTVFGVFGTVCYLNDFFQAWTSRIPAAFDQTWSLAVEEQFYFIWAPLLLLIITALRKRWQFASMLLFTGAGLLFIWFGANYFLPTGHLLALALGCFAGWGFANGWRPSLPQPAIYLAILILAVAVLWVPGSDLLERFWMVLRVGSAAVVVAHLVADRASLLSRMLSSRLLVWIGIRSYGIYLYGLGLLTLLPAVTGLGLKWIAPLSVFTTALVVAASYRWIEAPIRRAGRNWLQGNSLA